MTDKADVVSALAAEGDDIDGMVADLSEAQWRLDTPAPGWTIAHQVAHLAATFQMAGLAASDSDAFRALSANLGPDFTANVNAALQRFLTDPPERLLARWRAVRVATEGALAAIPPDQMVPWLVRPLPAAILARAGMMELFGHGQDIADALGVRRQYTDRTRFLVEFVTRTWDFGYLGRQLPVPEVEFRFEVTGPSGDRWEFGPADSPQRITGPAVDLCLLAVRRRHRDDLALTATGEEAEAWLNLAQAYRGPAGDGRHPGQFTTAL